MTTPRLQQQTLNMTFAWIGALATVIFLVFSSHAWMYRIGLPVAPALAAIAALLIGIIVRFKPNRATTLALCMCLGITFTAFSCCLTYVFGR